MLQVGRRKPREAVRVALSLERSAERQGVRGHESWPKRIPLPLMSELVRHRAAPVVRCDESNVREAHTEYRAACEVLEGRSLEGDGTPYVEGGGGTAERQNNPDDGALHPFTARFANRSSTTA